MFTLKLSYSNFRIPTFVLKRSLQLPSVSRCQHTGNRATVGVQRMKSFIWSSAIVFAKKFLVKTF